LKIEYVTDPVLVPGLRCPHCRGKVGQIRNHDPVKDVFWPVALAEPIIWMVFGIAAYVGYLYETVFAVALPLLFVAPVFAVWMYLKDIRRSDFICKTCNVQSSYAKVSSQRPGKLDQ
jgi:hypothetical protein